MGNRESFTQEYGPLAIKVGEKIGVAPEVILGQWGLETGWGKSVIPDTNNLGNIKDFRVGSDGVKAKDNANGSVDRYRKFKSLDEFGDHYASLIQRKYPDAVGTGNNAQAFGTGLKKGGYAEDPSYVDKIVTASKNIAETALNAIVPSATAAENTPAPDNYDHLFADLPSQPTNQAAPAYQSEDYDHLFVDLPKSAEAPTQPAPAEPEVSAYDKVVNHVSQFNKSTADLGRGVYRGVRDLTDGVAYVIPKGIEAAAGIVGADGVAKWAGDKATEISDINKRAEEEYQAKTEGSFNAGLGRVAGNVATAAIPVGGIAKAPQIAVAATKVPTVAKVLQAGKNVATGAAYGAVGTKTDEQSVADNAVLGGVVGAAAPLVLNRVIAPLGNAVKNGYQKLVDRAAEFGYTPSAAQVVNATEEAPNLLKRGINSLDKYSPVGGGAAREQLEQAVAAKINNPIGVDSTRLLREDYIKLPNAFEKYNNATAGVEAVMHPQPAIQQLADARAGYAVTNSPEAKVFNFLDNVESRYTPNANAGGVTPNRMLLGDLERQAEEAAASSKSAHQFGNNIAGQTYNKVLDTMNQTIDNTLTPAQKAIREEARDLSKRQSFAKALGDQLGKNDYTKSQQLMAATKASKDAPADLVKMAETIRDMRGLENSGAIDKAVTLSVLKDLGLKAGVAGGAGMINPAIPGAAYGANLALQSNKEPIVKALTGNTTWQRMLANNKSEAAMLAARLAAMFNQ